MPELRDFTVINGILARPIDDTRPWPAKSATRDRVRIRDKAHTLPLDLGFPPAGHRSTTRDASRRSTIFSHTPSPNERVELVERDDGAVDLVLVSPTANIVGSIPNGASGTANRLSQMNADAAAFWRGRDGTEGGVTNTVTNAIEEATRLRERVGGDEPATGDRRTRPAAMIASMNDAARKFWAPRR